MQWQHIINYNTKTQKTNINQPTKTKLFTEIARTDKSASSASIFEENKKKRVRNTEIGRITRFEDLIEKEKLTE